MPIGKSVIGVFYKSAGKVVDPPVCIPVKKHGYVDLAFAVPSSGSENINFLCRLGVVYLLLSIIHP
jgi:hypothetical protein